MPSSIANLVHLKELWLDDCQIQGTLPQAILQLPSLQQLFLSNNQIIQLPDSLPRLSLLRVLNLDGNQLVELPSLSSCLSLQTLLLRQNQLKELPALPEGLQVLAASSNQLVRVPNLPTTLTHLYLNANPLAFLEWNGPTMLQHVNVAHTFLEELPAGLADVDRVILAGTPYEKSLKQKEDDKMVVEAIAA